MKLNFTKMHGCGNDYIFINCFETRIDNPEMLSIQLSDRHFGIGGDGIILIMPSEIADARMRMFNLDGSEGKMCGNGIRCVAKYLYDNKIVRKAEITIETLSGIKKLALNVENDGVTSVRVDMGRAEILPENSIIVDGIEYAITHVSMGNPHCVVFCDDVDKLNLVEIGAKFENHEMFPERVNTEFVEVLAHNRLKMRVWERGSGETLACGTGTCAAAVAAVLKNVCDMNTDIHVQLLGGELSVCYTEDTVFMTGDCVKVFDGVIEI